jgi:hypothetical protein
MPGLQELVREAVFVGIKKLYPAILLFYANPRSVAVPEQEEIVSLCALASLSHRLLPRDSLVPVA